MLDMDFWTFLGWQVVLFVILIMVALRLDSMAGGGDHQYLTTRNPDSKKPSKSPSDKKEYEILYSCGLCQKEYSLPLADHACEHVKLLDDNGVPQLLMTTPVISLPTLESRPITGAASSKTLLVSLSLDPMERTIITILKEQDGTSMMKLDSLG